MTVVSEFAEGFNAWTFSQLGPFTTERLRVVAVQLLEALQAGEAAHLPHGDVKPCNVLIESRPLEGLCLKLQDWGLGQSRHRQPRETLAFRAPELGPEDAATLAGDVFSAGATLAALCTGHCLIEGRTAEDFREAWATFDVNGWQELCPHLDPGLLNWISWLLTLDPAERPATATEALEGLRDPSKRKRRRRAKPQRSALSQFLLLAYNGAVIAGLAWYWLWLTKNPVLELLGKGWC